MAQAAESEKDTRAGFYEPVSKRLARENTQRVDFAKRLRAAAKKMKVKKAAIGSPMAFRHELHVGVDSPILGSAMLNEVWDERGWTRKDLAYSVLLQLSPVSKSFPVQIQESDPSSEETISKLNVHKPSSKRANTIKRKAVPLDFPDILEPIPELPFDLENRSISPDSTTSSESSSSVDLSTPVSSKEILPIESSEVINFLHDESSPTGTVVKTSFDASTDDGDDENFVIVYAMGGEDDVLEVQ